MKKLMMCIFVMGAFGCDNATKTNAVTELPKIEDYDQTCQGNSDCDLVDGDDPCGCGYLVGINVSDVDVYREQFDRVVCDTVATDCELPEPFAPACVQGKCEARYIQEVKASNFSTSCETVEDCMLIAEGDVCQLCACPDIAVNAADYALQISPAECGSGDNVACNNCPQPDLGCVDNVCVAVDPI